MDVTQALIGTIDNMKEVQDQIEDVIIEVLEKLRDREFKKCRYISQIVNMKDNVFKL